MGLHKRIKSRAIIYCRVSTADQSNDLQRKELTEFVEKQGWDLVAILEDKATGTTTQRPQFQIMMDMVRARRVDVICVYKLDRFSRSITDLLVTLNDLRASGIDFVSYRDSGLDTTSPSGSLLLHLLAAFAQFEASLCKTRTLQGLAHARSKGVKLGRPPTFDRSAAFALKSEGLSYSEIAKRLGTSKTAVAKTLSKNRARKGEAK